MQTKTFTLLVAITDEPGHQAFDTRHLADLVAGALETGQVVCVIKGIPDARTPPVASATVDAMTGDNLRFPRNAADPVKAVTKAHLALHDA